MLDASFVPNPADWKAYNSTYIGETGTIDVRIEGEQLILHSREDKMEAICIPFAQDSFVGDLGLVEFLRDEDGKVKTLRRGKMFTHERVS